MVTRGGLRRLARMSVGERIFRVANTAFLVFLCAVTLYPMLHSLFASFSDPAQVISHTGPILRPLGFSTEAYRRVLSDKSIRTGYLNTLYVILFSTSLNVLMTSFAAYALSRKRVLFRSAIMVFIVITMFFGGGLIPFYLLVKGMGLGNSLWSLILPFAVSTWNIILMRTYLLSIPDSLEESARIDGANDYRILFSVIMPLAKPVLAVIVLYTAVGVWNGWFYAMVFLRARRLYPLQLILREILIMSSMEDLMGNVGDFDKALIAQTVKYATIIVATVPILVAYPFLQKYFVKGIMIGSLKG